MNKYYYELLGVTESSTDEEITQKYEQLRKKYLEDRFLEGEAGNEAAKMLNRIDVAYNEIMTERRESAASSKTDSSYANVEQLIREGKYNAAQSALDAFNERPAEWHYLQSIVFYRKNWVNESKKQLEIALQLEPENEKYKTTYAKLKEKIEYDRRQSEAQTGGNSYRSGPARPVDDSSYSNGNNGNGMSQMGGTGGLCESCATCCACNMLFNCCMNACCGCR